MPQLVKGGKYVFGWSKVAEDGSIRVPPEALNEYEYNDCDKLILLSGSKTSKGFSLTSSEKLRDSPFNESIVTSPLFETGECDAIPVGGRTFCWARLDAGVIHVPPETLKLYDVSTGDRVLGVRGSWLGIGFLVTGPIVVEAQKHELECFSV